jgi:hypothetical protein
MRQTDTNENPIPFDIEWRTWNKQNKMGGKLKSERNAVLCMANKKERNIVDILRSENKERIRKNPNHFQNRTRNIELQDGKVRSVSILLITKFNGRPVVY